MSEETISTVGATQKGNPYLIPGAIIIAGVLVAFAVFSTQGKTAAPVAGNTEIAGGGVEVTENDHVFGPEDPDVYFIEYSDYRCGYCGLFHETIQEVLKQYEGKVAWVYRHTPYQPGGKEAAVASECIAELVGEDAFWEYTDKAFKNQKSLSPDWSKQTALELGAEEGKYDECFASGKFDELFATNTFDAQELGGNGTPYNVLVTREGGIVKFSGAQPLENVKIFVNRALKSLE
jgi:protein-disulfide isomerase